MTAKKSSSGGIRITSDPDSTRVERPASAARLPIDVPFRVLFAADLTPDAGGDEGGSTSVRRVDKHSFAPVLQELSPTLEIEVPNRIAAEPRLIDVALQIQRLDDFDPDRVAEQIPGLAPLVEVRDLIDRVRAKELRLETFREELVERGIDREWARQLYETLSSDAPVPPNEDDRESENRRRRLLNNLSLDGEQKTGHGTSSSPPTDDSLDRLLSMVDAGEPDSETDADQPADQPDLVRSLIDAVAGTSSKAQSAGSRLQGTAADILLADLDDMIGRQLNAVFAHSRMREFEAAWRGLKFLVDRMDFRGGAELEILPVAKADVDDALYHNVLVPAHETGAGTSISLIVLGFEFDSSKRDIALLEELASTATSLQVPIVGSVDAHFFGAEHESGLERLPPLWQHLGAPQYVEWHKLRSKPEAGGLALALPRFLLRFPHSTDSGNDRFEFDEDGRLWGGAAILVGAAAAESVRTQGLPTHLTDYEVDDLAVWEREQAALPLAANLSTDRQRELAEAGFVTAGCTLGKDSARITNAPTIRQSGREAAAESSLACRLYLARLAAFLLILEKQMEDLDRDEDLEETIASVKATFEAFLHVQDEGVVRVEEAEASSESDRRKLAIRVVPPASVLNPPVPLEVTVLLGPTGQDAHGM